MTTIDKKRQSKSPATGRSGAATGVAIGAGLLGLALGFAGSLGRKFAVQTAASAQGNWDDILIAEHSSISAIFDDLEKTRHDQVAKRKGLVMKLKAALSKHALQEEMVIYPALIPSEAAGEQDDVYADHAEMKRWLNNLQHSPMSTPGFMSQVAALRKIVDEHVAIEEQDLFPALKAAKSAEDNRRLTAELLAEGLKLA